MNSKILYSTTEKDSREFLSMAETGGYKYEWYWELGGCCGARIAYSEEDFNSMKPYPSSLFDHTINRVDSTYNRGICVMLNPDVTKIKEIPDTILNMVVLGEDTLAIRILPYKHYHEQYLAKQTTIE